jgi:hypothetical protein
MIKAEIQRTFKINVSQSLIFEEIQVQQHVNHYLTSSKKKTKDVDGRK